VHIILFFLFTISSVSNNKAIEVHFTDRAPQIDGVIEEVWQRADSAYNFIQFDPYEKTNPSEKTVVYVLQDDNNLYIALNDYREEDEYGRLQPQDRIGVIKAKYLIYF